MRTPLPHRVNSWAYACWTWWSWKNAHILSKKTLRTNTPSPLFAGINLHGQGPLEQCCIGVVTSGSTMVARSCIFRRLQLVCKAVGKSWMDMIYSGGFCSSYAYACINTQRCSSFNRYSHLVVLCIQHLQLDMRFVHQSRIIISIGWICWWAGSERWSLFHQVIYQHGGTPSAPPTSTYFPITPHRYAAHEDDRMGTVS